MLAVFKTGGKQYSVKAGQILKVEKLEGKKGDNISFKDVLAVSENTINTIGSPLVDGAVVKAKILDQIRDKKIIVFKKRKRQNYRSTQGHRQHLTVLKIESISMDGKKSKSEKIVYGAFDIVSKKTDKSPIDFFHEALNNVKPSLEVRSRRVGGATYQVPMEVRPKRAQTLAMKWIVDSAIKRNEKTMRERVANEIFDAFNNKGNAVKKREETHKMAEANRAFSHFRW